MTRLLLALAFAGWSITAAAQGTTFTVTSTPRQVWQGWEGAILSNMKDYSSISADAWGSIFDLVVNDLGYTRARLSIMSGVEGSGSGYTVVNDNRDANTINPSGFNWTEFDGAVDILHTFRQKILASKQTPYLLLSYTDFGGGRTVHLTNPREYAEFMLAVFQHMQAKYGWVPDGIEAMLEPNDTNWSPTILATAIVAAGTRLQAAGFKTEFIAPSTSNMPAAPSYIDQMLSVSKARDWIAEFSYHRYGGGMAELKAIAARANQYGKRTSMLEYWGDFKTQNSGATFKHLGQDITIAQVSAWQQGVFTDNFGCVSQIVQLVNGTPQLCPNTKTTRQWTKYIRPGAQGFEITGALPGFLPVAFRNADGSFVVVVAADDASGAFTIGGVPALTYAVSQVDADGAPALANLPDQTATNGVLSGKLNGSGVVTFVSKGTAPSRRPLLPFAFYFLPLLCSHCSLILRTCRSRSG